jgi:hypothetical protein
MGAHPFDYAAFHLREEMMSDDEKEETAKAKPGKEKTPEQLATERLQRNGYSAEEIDVALETFGADAILKRRHRLECGSVGEHGEHGDLGADELKA